MQREDRRNQLTAARIWIGCAGWTVPAQHASLFPPSGSHLARYAQCFNAVEINTSFRRPHQPTSYRRWAATVPEGFAFAVKVPKAITHELRLVDTGSVFDVFLRQVSELGAKLGPLLFQLPPSLAFDASLIRLFCSALRARFDGNIVCEPRHRDWFNAEADDLLEEFRIARAAADPAIVEAAGHPGGWRGLTYFRLHGSPHVYRSEYGPDRLKAIARQLLAVRDDHSAWCIFDNTASGAATVDAFALQTHLVSRLS